MRVRATCVRVERRDQELRTPGEPLSGIERLVVVRADRIGDLVLTLPAVDAIRRTYPAAELSLVVASMAVSLAERVEGVSRAIGSGPRAAELRGALAGLAPDLVVCVSRGLAPALAAATAGVPQRVGSGYRYYSPLFTRSVREHRRTGGRHEVEYALSFAHRAGAPGAPARFAIRPHADSAAEVRAWLAEQALAGRFVILHPGSGGSCPRWPPHRFAELAAALRREGVPVVVTVGPADDDLASAPSVEAVEFGGAPVFRRSLLELAELVRCAALVVSNSTAPVHLAAAFGTPSLALHAPWASCGAVRWGPYHERGWALVADAPGATAWTPRQRTRGGAELMAGISVSLVRDCVRTILDGGSPESTVPGGIERVGQAE